jgi:biotin transport system substrate-specific component
MKIRDMVFTAVFAAILCVVAPLAIPIGPVPISLATFVIYLAAAVLNWKYGTLAVVVYVALGLVGLPVFSGFTGGIPKLIGPTGGFIAGYILMALVIGLIITKNARKKWSYPAAMALGTVVLYVCGLGWVWLDARRWMRPAVCRRAVSAGDVVMIVLAAVIAPRMRNVVVSKRPD